MNNEPIKTQATERTLKNFIIGKLWVTSKDGSNPGVLRINRDLPKDIILTKGTSIFLHENKKREGKIDPDYSVSILLPIAQADELIAMVNDAKVGTEAQVA